MNTKEYLLKVWRLRARDLLALKPLDIETGGSLLLFMGIGGMFILVVSLLIGDFEENKVTIFYGLIMGVLGLFVYKKVMMCLYIAVYILIGMVFLSVISLSGMGLVVNGAWLWVALKSTPWYRKKLLKGT